MSTVIYRSTNARPCASCGQPGGYCLRSCPDRSQPVLSLTGVIDAVQSGPQSHAAGRSLVPRVPVGPMVLIVAGLALMGLGLMMNAQVSWLIYNLIHR